jgi:type I restriction enzyme S subunit
MGQNRHSHEGGNPLPEGWVTKVSIDGFSQISTNGKNVKTKECISDGHFPVVDQGQKLIAGFVNDKSKVIQIIDPIILFGDHTRIIKWVDFDFVPGADGTKILSPLSFLNARFAYYQLRSLDIPDKGYSRHFKFLKELIFSIPPLAEQKVIADKLDTLLAQVETTKARLDRIPQILKTFRQSVLAAAVSGKLTEEWRSHNKLKETARTLKQRWLFERISRFDKEQEELIALGKQKKAKKFKEPLEPDLQTGTVEAIPDSWELVSVSQFAECLDNLRVPVKKEMRQASKGLYPYFGANGQVDKVDDYLFDDEIVMVTEDETFYGRTKPIAYRYSGKCWVNNHAHVLKAPTKESNDFLCFALMYYKITPWLSGTTGRAKLTQAALNTLPLGLPPVDEQIEIVHRVEQLFAHVDQIEQQVQPAQQRVDKLTQSILAKAFRGELTSQWRKDNPELISGDNSSESLLAKIKAEREANTPKKKRKNIKAKA